MASFQAQLKYGRGNAALSQYSQSGTTSINGSYVQTLDYVLISTSMSFQKIVPLAAPMHRTALKYIGRIRSSNVCFVLLQEGCQQVPAARNVEKHLRGWVRNLMER